MLTQGELTQNDVAGITLLEVTWANWGPLYTPRVSAQEGPARMASFLTTLLEGADGWLLVDSDTRIADRRIVESGLAEHDPMLAPWRWFTQNAPRLPHGPDTRPSHRTEGHWRTGPSAAAAVRFVTDGLTECDNVSRQARAQGRQLLVIAQMNLFRCRVHMCGDRVWTVFGNPPPAAPDPATELYLDLRFRSHLEGYWLQAMLAAHTQPVTNPAHTPYPGGVPRRVQSLDEASQRARLLEQVIAPAFRDAMRGGFPPRRTSVFGHDYGPPRLVVASGPALDPPLDPEHPPDGLTRLALGAPDPRSRGIAQGVLNGSVRAYRRFRTGIDGSEIPSYLLIPETAPATEQEDTVRAVIMRLINIETEAAAALYDVATEVEMVSHLVRTYQDVTRQAGQYWDRLALHLPVATGPFRRPRPGQWSARDLYQRIQFVQQVLIQGVADIQQLRTAAEGHVRRVDLEAAALRDEFDKLLTERAVDAARSIRDAICGTGYVERTRREAVRVAEEATRAAETYTALLEAVSSAFDERRARETDQFQALAIVFAAVVGLLGLANEGFGLWLNNWVATPVAGFLAFLVVLLVVAGVIGLASYRLLKNVGQLATTAQFEAKYRGTLDQRSPGLRAYLDVSRTERLNATLSRQAARERATADAAECDELQRAHHRHWDTIDQELVGKFTAVLDDPYLLDPVSAQDSSAPDAFGPRIERWAIAALLASERPRSLSRYGLPRLALCYTFLPLPGSDVAAPHVPLTSRSDLELMLHNQCACEVEHVERVLAWGNRQTERARHGELTARGFAELLAALGVRAGMGPTQRDEMLQHMADPETATGP